MKCDKCGFEHNSRSVCPKCGARVVYVNEDYLKRRQEWEEAQKKGQAENALPPGIMHSTKEEYEAGRAGKKEGRSETTGLSFDVVKKKLITGIAYVISFFKKLSSKDRRKRNPVIRKIVFDDGKSKIDDSPLVVSHKKFKSRLRKPAIIGGAALLFAIAMFFTFFAIKNADHSRLFYYDGVNGYIVGEKRPVFEDLEHLMFVQGKNSFLAVNSETVLVYGKKLYQYEMLNTRIIAHNDNFSMVIGSSDDGTFVLKNGSMTKVLEKGDWGYSDSSFTSKGGRYAAFVACEELENGTISTLYLCKDDGQLQKVDEITGEINVKYVTDSGKIWYERMTQGEYGIINQTDLIFSTGTKNVPICLNVVDSLYSDEKIWYISENEKLYCADVDNYEENSLCDSQVLGIQLNHYTDETQVIYLKSDGYYLCDTQKCIIYSSNPSMTVYYQPQKKYAVGIDTDAAWYVNNCETQAAKNEMISLKKDTSLVCLEENGEILLVTGDEKLLCLDGGTVQLAKNIKSIQKIENSSYFEFYDGVSGYIQKKRDSKEKALSEDIIEVNKIAYSHGKIYFENMDGKLCAAGKNGKTAQKIENVREWFLLSN